MFGVPLHVLKLMSLILLVKLNCPVRDDLKKKKKWLGLILTAVQRSDGWGKTASAVSERGVGPAGSDCCFVSYFQKGCQHPKARKVSNSNSETVNAATVKGLMHPEPHLTLVKWSSGCSNPFTATLAALSFQKRQNKVRNPKSISFFCCFILLFFFFFFCFFNAALSCERICMKTHSTESRFAIGPKTFLFANVCFYTFQTGSLRD